MPLTPEQKRANKVQRVLERYEPMDIRKCINDVAILFQKLVRLRGTDQYGMLTCCTCGKRGPAGRDFDAGHWIGRAKSAVVFDERNCHPQCVTCNRFTGGDVSARYAKFMLTHYGEDVMDELILLGNQPTTWTREELAELNVSFREELNQ